jgi:hypothetical protein
MAMRLGTENKRQVYMLIVLFVVIVLVGGYELFGGSSAPKPTPPPVRPTAIQTASGTRPAIQVASTSGLKEAQKFSNDGIDPALHLDRLALSEGVQYRGTGRSIFGSTMAAGTAHIEKPVSSPRPVAIHPVVKAGPVVPEKPRPPAIALKYFGYTQGKDKSIKAYFVHGDDVFAARPGEIIDHRYKVESIEPLSVRVTDLSYNNTETLPMQAK